MVRAARPLERPHTQFAARKLRQIRALARCRSPCSSSARRSERTPRRRQPSNQESVRSTTHRCRPSRWLESIPRRARRGVMPRDRRARRSAAELQALSACSFAGRFRGRPGFSRGPMMGGMASTSESNWVASWALAAERRIASGIPLRSTTTWYLVPGLPRSVGLGPVCSPPFGAHADAIEARSAPVDGRLVAEPVQQRLVQLLPDPSLLPVAQPSPAGGAAAATQFLGQQPPGAACS